MPSSHLSLKPCLTRPHGGNRVYYSAIVLFGKWKLCQGFVKLQMLWRRWFKNFICNIFSRHALFFVFFFGSDWGWVPGVLSAGLWSRMGDLGTVGALETCMYPPCSFRVFALPCLLRSSYKILHIKFMSTLISILLAVTGKCAKTTQNSKIFWTGMCFW